MSEKKSKYEELAAINVGTKIEKKNGLSYLSWAWALDTLMRADPDASWDYGEPKMFADTMMVYCTVTAFGKARTAHLPVMDYKNQPIKNPNAFQVNTAMQRALVKAIALHGLGLYIYAGEDLPPADTDAEQEPVKESSKSIAQAEREKLPPEQQHKFADLHTEVMDEFNSKGAEAAYDMYAQIRDNLADPGEVAAFRGLFDSKVRTAFTRIYNERKPQKEAA